MQEIGIESSVLKDILSGQKTIEGRLGKPKFLKIRAGDEISLREDIWKNGKVESSIPDVATIRIKQVLYFESFNDMLGSLNYRAFIPSAKNIEEALATYRKFYSPEDEKEYGAVAFLFELV